MADRAKPGRKKIDRPKFLVMVTHSSDRLELFSAHSSEKEACGIAERLAGLTAAGVACVHIVPVPDDLGVASIVVTSLPSVGEAAALPRAASPSLAPSMPQAAPSPPPVRFRSAAEFEAETIAMMNGEIPADGIQMRDADDPISEGGAFS